MEYYCDDDIMEVIVIDDDPEIVTIDDDEINYREWESFVMNENDVANAANILTMLIENQRYRRAQTLPVQSNDVSSTTLDDHYANETIYDSIDDDANDASSTYDSIYNDASSSDDSDDSDDNNTQDEKIDNYAQDSDDESNDSDVEVDEVDCAICMKSIKRIEKLKCGHEFCLNCICNWFCSQLAMDGEWLVDVLDYAEPKLSCPLCRDVQDVETYKEMKKKRVKRTLF